MNLSALAMALQSNNFRARLFNALRNVTQKGYSVDHIQNRHGVECLAVRVRNGELSFRVIGDKELPRKEVFKLLRAA